MIMPYMIIALLVLLVVSAIASALKKAKLLQFLVSTAVFIGIAALSLCLLSVDTSTVLFDMLDLYPFSLFFIALLSIGMLLINILSYRYSNDYTDLSLLLGFAFAGMVMVPASVSILTIFLGLELISVSTTFMIMLGGKRHVESALKFFLMSSVSIAVFSFALALLFPYNASLGLVSLTQNINIGGNYLIMLSLILFVSALAFDVALFPFNLWVPDVYQGSPGSTTAMLAGLNKKVSFAALILISFLVFTAYKSVFSVLFLLLSVATMFFGNILALVQSDVKRLFAYSSISQAGYIMIGLSAATSFGIEASLFQIFAHSFMVIGAFAIVLWLESLNVKTINDYTGLNGRNSFAAFALTILMLSMAGIPPLLGFYGKFLLFSSAIDSKLVLLAMLGILNSFISVYYYTKVISAMYTQRRSERIKIERFAFSVALIALVVIVVLGIYPQPLISAAALAAKSIMGI